MEPFTIIPQFGLLVCTECRSACLGCSAKTHLRTTHPEISLARRKSTVQAIAQQGAALIQTKDDLARIPDLTATPQPVFQCLGAPVPNGLRCNYCGQVKTSPISMRDHCRTVHKWQNDIRRGGNIALQQQRSAARPWTTGVSCQRLFTAQHRKEWFPVVRGPSPQASATEGPPALLETFLSQQRQHLVGARTTTIEEGSDKLEPNLWVQRVQWAQHLRGLDRDVLLPLVSLDPSEGWGHGDPERTVAKYRTTLQLFWDSFGRIVRQAQQTTTLAVVGLPVLLEIRKRSEGDDVHRPFNSAMEPDTLVRYLRYWKQILGFIVRCSLSSLPAEEQPPFRMTEAQANQLDTLTDHWESQPEESPEADRMLLDLVVQLLDHQLLGNAYDSVLLSALAVMGVKADGSWVRPEHYTQAYSAVLKLARMLVVRQAYLACQGDPKLHPITRVRARANRLLRVMSATTLPTPVDWIYRARSYGMKIQYTSSVAGQVQWDGQRISLGDVRFTMDELVNMVHRLAAEAGRAMGDLLLGLSLPEVTVRSLQDDMSDDTPGGSFLTDPRNAGLLADGPSLIVRRVFGTPALCQEWVEEQVDAPDRIRPLAIKHYGGLVGRFRELLLLLVHLTAGQPGRATEILNVRHTNTSYGGTRNIFILYGRVCIRTTYHKGMRSQETTKVVYRFLPDEVGILLVRYLWVVLPFWHGLEIMQHGGGPAPVSAFLWAVDVVRRRAAPSEEAESGTPELGGGEEGDCRTEQEAVWTSDRMRGLLGRAAGRLIGSPLTVAGWRHIAIAIARRYLTKVDLRLVQVSNASYDEDSAGGDPDDSEEEGDDSIWDLQAAHSSYTAGMVYGRGAQQGFGLIVRQESFCKVSQAWHTFLGFGGHHEGHQPHKRKRSTYDQFQLEQASARQRRAHVLRQVDLGAWLRRMLRSDEARFRTGQLQAVEAVVRGHSPIVQVAGTGAGKSLTFLLPAYCQPDGVTVVVVPMVSLQADLLRRCGEVGIAATIWSYDSPQSATIVLVTPEAAVTQAFQDFTNRLIGRQQLDRVVIDECHLILGASSAFRPALLQISRTFLGAMVQVAYLTATLPPRDVAHFFDLVHVHPGQAVVVRSRTTRRNISYHCLLTQDQPEEERLLVRRLTEFRERRGAGVKVVVYCQQVRQADDLARTLQCLVFHSQISDRARVKAGRVQQWVQAGGVIVSTSALGVGIDIPDVRLVVHMGLPRSMVDFVQESGRGGRDGEASQSWVICSRSRTVGGAGKEVGDTAEMALFVRQADSCRRVMIDQVIDGSEGRTGCEEGEEACDACARATEGAEPARAEGGALRLYDRPLTTAATHSRMVQRTAGEQLEQLKAGLQFWLVNCLLCLGEEGYVRHGFDSCEKRSTELWRAQVDRVRHLWKLIRTTGMRKYTGCFSCAVPQEFCGRWQGDEQGRYSQRKGGQCLYRDVVVRVVAWGTAPERKEEQAELWRAIQGEVKQEGQTVTDTQLVLWCVRQATWDHVKSSNLCKLFTDIDSIVRG